MPVITLIILLLLPATVFAATDSSTVSGTISDTLSITAPDSFTFASLEPGATSESNNGNIAISSNLAGSWNLKADSNSSGLMENGGVQLGQPLAIKGGMVSDYTSLASQVTLTDAGSGSSNITVSFSQQVTFTDAPGSYSMTVNFTVTANS